MTHDPEYMGRTGIFRPLSEVDLESMTEMELRVLKQERYWAQQDLKMSDRKRYSELREEALTIREVHDRKHAETVRGYRAKALLIPGAISTEIDGVAAEAWGDFQVPG